MNNKGITLIEIIISIVLISIVLIFLFSLLVTVNDINYESEVNSTYLINKSLILKNIEEDFNKAKKITVDNCQISQFYTAYPAPGDTTYFQKKGVYSNNLEANNCIKFTYEWENDDKVSDSSKKEAFLGIYYYKNKGDYVISYNRGINKATRILPDYETNNVNDNGTLKRVWVYTDGPWDTKGFYNIYIPIISKEGKDYSLNISYYKP